MPFSQLWGGVLTRGPPHLVAPHRPPPDLRRANALGREEGAVAEEGGQEAVVEERGGGVEGRWR